MLWTVVLEKTLENSLELQGDQSWRKSALNIHWKYWCWSSSILATWFEELTHWKRSWCWEIFRATGKGDDRGWDGGMASLTQWTWVWVNSGRYWRTGKPGMLQSMQRVGHHLATEHCSFWTYTFWCDVFSCYFTINHFRNWHVFTDIN